MEKKDLQYICTVSEDWVYSEVYFDIGKGRFVEERFHYEYLDTGTICDGFFEIKDEILWKKLIRSGDKSGINKFLEIRGSMPTISK